MNTSSLDLIIQYFDAGGDGRQNELSQKARAELDNLKRENEVMYAAILEASQIGIAAAGRCQIELQRIARKDAGLK